MVPTQELLTYYFNNNIVKQIQSFETELAIPEVAAKEGGPPTFRAVFIRAPAILEVGPDVQILADVPASSVITVSSHSSTQELTLLHMMFFDFLTS